MTRKLGKRPRTKGVLHARLSRNLRRLRNARELSQTRLAKLCRLSRNYVGALERAQRNPTLAVIERIAACLRVDPLTLLRD